jgi:hypothetical protein
MASSETDDSEIEEVVPPQGHRRNSGRPRHSHLNQGGSQPSSYQQAGALLVAQRQQEAAAMVAHHAHASRAAAAMAGRRPLGPVELGLLQQRHHHVQQQQQAVLAQHAYAAQRQQQQHLLAAHEQQRLATAAAVQAAMVHKLQMAGVPEAEAVIRASQAHYAAYGPTPGLFLPSPPLHSVEGLSKPTEADMHQLRSLHEAQLGRAGHGRVPSEGQEPSARERFFREERERREKQARDREPEEEAARTQKFIKESALHRERVVEPIRSTESLKEQANYEQRHNAHRRREEEERRELDERRRARESFHQGNIQKVEKVEEEDDDEVSVEDVVAIDGEKNEIIRKQEAYRQRYEELSRRESGRARQTDHLRKTVVPQRVKTNYTSEASRDQKEEIWRRDVENKREQYEKEKKRQQHAHEARKNFLEESKHEPAGSFSPRPSLNTEKPSSSEDSHDGKRHTDEDISLHAKRQKTQSSVTVHKSADSEASTNTSTLPASSLENLSGIQTPIDIENKHIANFLLGKHGYKEEFLPKVVVMAPMRWRTIAENVQYELQGMDPLPSSRVMSSPSKRSTQLMADAGEVEKASSSQMSLQIDESKAHSDAANNSSSNLTRAQEYHAYMRGRAREAELKVALKAEKRHSVALFDTVNALRLEINTLKGNRKAAGPPKDLRKAFALERQKVASLQETNYVLSTKIRTLQEGGKTDGEDADEKIREIQRSTEGALRAYMRATVHSLKAICHD